jgi:hypothetical protein
MFRYLYIIFGQNKQQSESSPKLVSHDCAVPFICKHGSAVSRFTDIAFAGYVFGDQPLEELAAKERVAWPGGMIIRRPGNNDTNDDCQRRMVERGFDWGTFVEPVDGPKRKYFKRL